MKLRLIITSLLTSFALGAPAQTHTNTSTPAEYTATGLSQDIPLCPTRESMFVGGTLWGIAVGAENCGATSYLKNGDKYVEIQTHWGADGMGLQELATKDGKHGWILTIKYAVYCPSLKARISAHQASESEKEMQYWNERCKSWDAANSGTSASSPKRGVQKNEAEGTASFDQTSWSLPPRFQGDDPKRIANRFSSITKSEFETTAQFEQRRQAAASSGDLVFVIPPAPFDTKTGWEAKYDADAQQLRIIVRFYGYVQDDHQHR